MGNPPDDIKRRAGQESELSRKTLLQETKSADLSLCAPNFVLKFRSSIVLNYREYMVKLDVLKFYLFLAILRFDVLIKSKHEFRLHFARFVILSYYDVHQLPHHVSDLIEIVVKINNHSHCVQISSHFIKHPSILPIPRIGFIQKLIMKINLGED